jgi:hypothetical protein
MGNLGRRPRRKREIHDLVSRTERKSMKHEEKSMRDLAGGLKIRVGKLNSRTRLAGSRATAKSEIHERGPSPAERENQAGKEGISAPKWTTARNKFHDGKN